MLYGTPISIALLSPAAMIRRASARSKDKAALLIRISGFVSKKASKHKSDGGSIERWYRSNRFVGLPLLSDAADPRGLSQCVGGLIPTCNGGIGALA
jgi:hypothetical protein